MIHTRLFSFFFLINQKSNYRKYRSLKLSFSVFKGRSSRYVTWLTVFWVQLWHWDVNRILYWVCVLNTFRWVNTVNRFLRDRWALPFAVLLFSDRRGAFHSGERFCHLFEIDCIYEISVLHKHNNPAVLIKTVYICVNMFISLCIALLVLRK